ncbi:MAG: hypothetical protein KGS61_11735 [Verrucomicrobia bacterium]|nr:hypothetical protein [Verrucomicrobiota bacterium]
MRLRVILLLSLGVNLALGAVLCFVATYPGPHGVALLPPKARPRGTNVPTKTQVVVRRQFFTWAEVESPDYPTYIANLRRIGCPEPTIRDIIVADVNQIFAKRRATEVVLPDQQWWRSEPDPAVVQAAADKVQALETERRALLTRLLGPGWETSGSNGDGSASAGVSLSGPVLGALSPDAKQAVQAINRRAQQRMRDYLAAQAKAGKPTDPAELARLRQQTRGELAKVLTPDQLEEYLLRYSSTASHLRAELRGMNVTPDEFRGLFRARDGLDAQIDLASGDDPAAAQRRRDLEQQRDDAVKQALGPDQYQLFQLNQDPVYRAAVATANQAGAPPDKVMPLYQLQQLTATERQRILDDDTLTDEERAGALELVQQDLAKSMQKLLGDEAYQRFQQQSATNQNTQTQSPPVPPALQEALEQSPPTPPASQ